MKSISLFCLGLAGAFPLAAQTTAFTYQGRLQSDARPAAGLYDFRFKLYSDALGNTQIGGSVTTNGLALSEGLFTASIDFGPGAFTGAPRWLEIGVKTNGGAGYAILTPLQAFSATPQATFAQSAGALSGSLPISQVNGTVPLTQLPAVIVTNNALNLTLGGTFSGSGNNLTGVDASSLNGLAGTAFWKTNGNLGANPTNGVYLGTTDAFPLEFRVSAQRVLRLENVFGLPNLIGGHVSNAVVAGHAGSVIAGGGSAGYPNRIDADNTVVGGGVGNQIQANANQSMIGGGFNNRIAAGAYGSFLGGGENNLIGADSYDAAILGGGLNTVQPNAAHAVILGGYQNTVGASFSLAAGTRARAAHAGTFVWADPSPGEFASTASGQFLIRAAGGVGINTAQPNGAALAVNGVITGNGSGLSNVIIKSMGGGGTNHFRFTDTPGAEQIFLHAQRNLDLEAEHDATFWAGNDFTSVVDHDFQHHTKHNATATVDNNLDLTVGVGLSTSIGGNMTLTAGNGLSVTAGNGMSLTSGSRMSLQATDGVGLGTADPRAHLHVYSVNNPTVVRIQSTGTPGFGRVEFVSNPQGDGNEWRPSYIQSTDAGGFTGGLSFVVNGTGAANKFAEIEAMRIQNGRVGIGTANPVSALQVVGTVTATAFNPPSDRNLKENFVPVNPGEVLEKVAALPISRWNFKGDAETAHLGPMAQDFYAAFGTGTDERHIATVDADGVALAAIQGLNEKLEQTRAENLLLKARLEKLEKLLLTNGK